MKVYLVGGAVRDELLDLPVLDRDWVVVGATTNEMLAAGYTQVGKDFPVFLHPQTKEEYALARTERKSGQGYTGFSVQASPEVTLEEDLLRRDLTINAMAKSDAGEIIDPFNGQDDLAQGLLRHVSPAFSEDPVRILRIARFAARFAQSGFKVAHGTNALMRTMVANGEIDYLVPERVWSEWCKALETGTPEKFFQVLRGCQALKILFPEVNSAYTKEGASHTNDDLPTPLSSLKQVALQTSDTKIRFSALMFALFEQHDQHEATSKLNTLCKRLKVPKHYAQLAQKVIGNKTHICSQNADELLQVFLSTRAFKQTESWQGLLDTYLSLEHITPTTAEQLEKLRITVAGVSAQQFNQENLTGPELGAAIKNQQRLLIRENLSKGNINSH
ncbi:MAG: hypothetical protein V3V12_09285 [Gammaproteobacteria bacterium]